jgi:DNA-binding response OmpR family regulator
MPDHILVVDDDPDIAESLAMILEDEGFEVTIAANGIEALRAVETTPPEAIVLDMLMPIMDGAQFAAELALRYTPRPPIVVVSATHDVRDRADAIGAEEFLMKPFDVRSLCATLARLCARSREERPGGNGHGGATTW